jgi:spermidine synthase
MSWSNGDRLKRSSFFVFFFISGFCSLVYEIVWLRLSMAKFGVTTPLVSIVLSVFMAGLGLGSWAGGKFSRRFDASPAPLPLRFYGALELIIGFSGLAAPRLLDTGYSLLRDTGKGLAWASSLYYLASGLWITVALLPWCTAMGATFPLAMAALRKIARDESERSFSYLYLANLLGALLGTLVPAVALIELFGFRGTLHIAAALNFTLAAAVFLLSSSLWQPVARAAPLPPVRTQPGPPPGNDTNSLALLFITGLCSMAMEVVWIRQFTVYLGSVVYAFAAILSLYLCANYIGSHCYRVWARTHDSRESRTVWIVMGLAALLPLLLADPRLPFPDTDDFGRGFLLGMLRAGFGIMPFSALAGFATPMLVDRVSQGDPDSAGRAYAVNVLGSILGPVLAGFYVLPWAGERWSLCAIAAPLLASGLATAARAPQGSRTILRLGPQPLYCLALLLCFPLAAFTEGYDDEYPRRMELRDYTATVVAAGEGMERQLLTNGTGMTKLTTIAKMMAHIPLSLLQRPASRGLVICFGMGTTFRSMLSWGIHTTAVELVPSVPKVFGYFHPDGPALLRSPLAQVVIDDGRRFLERSNEQFDVITVDPPPPLAAPASSLLYSREFYAIIRQHLRPGGIAQVWVPASLDKPFVTQAAIARALVESFPHVRAFQSVGRWGTHFLASLEPFAANAVDQLPQPLPPPAARDLVEWEANSSPAGLLAKVLSQEESMQDFLQIAPYAPAIEDDRPINEYFLLRNYWPGLER